MKHVVCNLEAISIHGQRLDVIVHERKGGLFKKISDPFSRQEIKGAISGQLRDVCVGQFWFRRHRIRGSWVASIVFEDVGEASLIYLMKKK